MSQTTNQLTQIGPRTARALVDLLDEKDDSAEQATTFSRGRRDSIDVYFVEITSTSKVSGRYPGTRYSYAAKANAWTAEDSVWVVSANGDDLATGTKYPAIRAGVADSKPVWLTVPGSSTPETNGFLFFGIGDDINSTSATLTTVFGIDVGDIVSFPGWFKFEAALFWDADIMGGVQFGVDASDDVALSYIEYQVQIYSDMDGTVSAWGRVSAPGGSVGTLGPVSGFATIHGTARGDSLNGITLTFAQQSASGTSTLRKSSSFTVWKVG